MAKHKNTIQIENLGEAVMHIQAVWIYLDKEHKKKFRFFVALVSVGFLIGLRYWATIETVNIKELTPLGMVSGNPFLLVAGEKGELRIGDKAQIIFHGKEYGVIDSTYSIYKYVGRDAVFIYNKKTGRAYEMELPVTK